MNHAPGASMGAAGAATRCQATAAADTDRTSDRRKSDARRATLRVAVSRDVLEQLLRAAGAAGYDELSPWAARALELAAARELKRARARAREAARSCRCGRCPPAHLVGR